MHVSQGYISINISKIVDLRWIGLKIRVHQIAIHIREIVSKMKESFFVKVRGYISFRSNLTKNEFAYGVLLFLKWMCHEYIFAL